jgi:hypothetical protein
MATFDYAGMRDGFVTSLMERFGTTMLVIDPGEPGDYDPAIGGNTPAVPTPHETLGAIDSYNLNEVDGDRIRATDRKIVVVAKEGMPAPKPGWTVQRASDGAAWSILTVKNLEPAETAVAYELQTRT